MARWNKFLIILAICFFPVATLAFEMSEEIEKATGCGKTLYESGEKRGYEKEYSSLSQGIKFSVSGCGSKWICVMHTNFGQAGQVDCREIK